MVVIADVSVPAEQFELGALFEDFPEITIEIERIIPIMSGLMPLFWVTSPDIDGVEELLRRDPLAERVTRLTEADERALFEVRWSADIDHFLTPLVGSEGDVLRAEGHADAWQFRIQFQDRSFLRGFIDSCAEHGIEAEVHRLYDPRPPDDVGLLTDEQLEAIVRAHEAGYWEVPRRATNAALAAELGISPQAVSERLRRGLGRLVGQYVVPDVEED